MPNFWTILVVVVFGALLPFAWKFVFELTCPCERIFAEYGEIRLREPQETATSWNECTRCGRKYVKATDWARAVIMAEKTTDAPERPTGGDHA